jgi:hypothetical protein
MARAGGPAVILCKLEQMAPGCWQLAAGCCGSTTFALLKGLTKTSNWSRAQPHDCRLPLHQGPDLGLWGWHRQARLAA